MENRRTSKAMRDVRPGKKWCPDCPGPVPIEDFGLNRASPDGRTRCCRACTRRAAAIRKAKKLEPAQTVTCRHCGTDFLPAHPNCCYCSEDCRTTRQKAIHKAQHQAFEKANRDIVNARKRRWRATNPEKARAQRMRHYHAYREQEKAAFRAWQIKNRTHLTAMQHEYDRRKTAILEGKSAFAEHADGFVLVRAQTGFWRASAIGERLGRTEQIIARYECVDGSWIVRPPVIATEAQKRTAGRLARLEERQVRRYLTQGAAQSRKEAV